MSECHPHCALTGDHPGYMQYRCVDEGGQGLPFDGEEGCGAWVYGGHVFFDGTCDACASVRSDAPEWTI